MQNVDNLSVIKKETDLSEQEEDEYFNFVKKNKPQLKINDFEKVKTMIIPKSQTERSSVIIKTIN